MAKVLYASFTKEDFESRYGVSLDARVPDGEYDDKVTRFISIAVEKVTDYIAANAMNIDTANFATTASITANQLSLINRAAMMQAKYMLDNGDFSTLSGFSAITNAKALSAQDIAELQLCQEAKNLLNDRVIDRSLGA